MPSLPPVILLLSGFLLSLLAVSCDSSLDSVRPEVAKESAPTYYGELATLLSENCASCHREGGSAPFELTTYESAHKRARMLLEATESGYMPPWLPSKEGVPLAHERSLSEQEIELIRRWIAGGKQEGNPAELSVPPHSQDGWQLGEPDFVLSLEKAFLLPAEGGDVFRNLVLPVQGVGEKFVRAVEIRPGRSQVVHHVWGGIDASDSCRRLDEKDPDLGFGGMGMGQALPPDGHFLAWTPGKNADPGQPGMAWRIRDGMDLVLQLHMLPGGKEERIQPKIGLYFTDQAPTRIPYALSLKMSEIDIPAGDANYVVKSSFVVPVATELASLYPHAHYLCREMEITAHLPGANKEILLLRIDDWDFQWQDQYQLAEALALPAGTRLDMSYRYDNSEDNPRNPSSPPQRVRWGDRSSDEMGSLLLQLIPGNAQDYAKLREAGYRHAAEAQGGFVEHYNYGTALQHRGDHAKAVLHFQKATALDPSQPIVHYNLSGSLAGLGRIDEAIATMRESIRLDPSQASAHLNLGHFLVKKNDLRGAAESYQRTLDLDPGHPQATKNLTAILRHLEGR